LVKAADLFLMTSVFEGKSIALEEAKILKKPIVITQFSTASEQIIDEKTGLIAEMNAQSVAEKIEKIYRDQDFKNEIINHLSQEKLGNEDEILKFYQLIHE
jgi:glycosyltransferase involved in cell wall biosynthesis